MTYAVALTSPCYRHQAIGPSSAGGSRRWRGGSQGASRLRLADRQCRGAAGPTAATADPVRARCRSCRIHNSRTCSGSVDTPWHHTSPVPTPRRCHACHTTPRCSAAVGLQDVWYPGHCPHTRHTERAVSRHHRSSSLQLPRHAPRIPTRLRSGGDSACGPREYSRYG